uniref:Uncharacterized protein n=1 Tax=Meloidogyne enterolobii TaxID=390850 RepID=A0A6V7VVC5_MELEN|nr:unnamed protein product [Meloidogyne enterolobii]
MFKLTITNEKIRKQKMPPILVWNSFNDESAPGIGYPEYPVEFPNITCPYKCSYTRDKKLKYF